MAMIYDLKFDKENGIGNNNNFSKSPVGKLGSSKIAVFDNHPASSPADTLETTNKSEPVQTNTSDETKGDIKNNVKKDGLLTWAAHICDKINDNFNEKYGYYDANHIQDNVKNIITEDGDGKFTINQDKLKRPGDDENFYKEFLERAIDVANKYVSYGKTFSSFKEFEKAVFAKKDNKQYKDIKKLKETNQAIEVLKAVYNRINGLNKDSDIITYNNAVKNGEDPNTKKYRDRDRLDKALEQANNDAISDRLAKEIFSEQTNIDNTIEGRNHLANGSNRKEMKRFLESKKEELNKVEKKLETADADKKTELEAKIKSLKEDIDYIENHFNVSWWDDKYPVNSEDDPNLKFYLEAKKRKDLLDHNINNSDGLSAEKLEDNGLSRSLIQKLAPLMKDNGTYNLKQVGDILKKSIGADAKWNTYAEGERSETEEARENICKILGIDSNNKKTTITDKDIEELMEFFGIEKETNRNNAFTKGYKEALFGGTATAIAGAFARVDITQVVNVVNGLVNEVVAEQMVTVAAGPLAGLALPISLALNTVGNLLFDEGKGEQTCFKYERILNDIILSDEGVVDLKTFEQKLDKYGYTDNQQKGMLILASLFHAKCGDNWVKEMKKSLDRAAGNPPVLNCEEFALAIPELENELAKRPYYVKLPEVTIVPEAEAETEAKAGCLIEWKEQDSYKYNVKGGDTWVYIVTKFYPCLVEKYGLYGKDGAIRKLKNALEIDPFKEKDIPKTLYLPRTIENCELDENNKKFNRIDISKTGGTTTLRSAGIETKYNAIDGCDRNYSSGYCQDKNVALQKLKAQTRKNYTNENE